MIFEDAGLDIAQILAASGVAATLAGAGEVLKRSISKPLDVNGPSLTPAISPTTVPAEAAALPLAGAVVPPSPLPPEIIPEFGDVQIQFPVLDKAVADIRAAPARVGENFRETAELVRKNAFAVTADLTADTVAEVQEVIAEAITEGTNQADAVKTLKGLLDEGSGLSQVRLDMVFRTNVASSIESAKEKMARDPMVVDQFPYRQYVATDDNRVRPEHLALETSGLNGTAVYGKDDPAWRVFRPPWGFSCRCTGIPLTIQQAAAAGVKEAIAWMQRAVILAGPDRDFANFLGQAAPASFQTVPWPTLDGKRIQPNPEFV